MIMLRIVIAALVVGLGSNVSAQEPLARDLEPVRTLHVKPDLVDEDDEPAVDISGIACTTNTGSLRRCLVINDEDRSAQLATLDGDRLIGGPRIKLIGKKASADTLGHKPKAHDCSDGEGKFKDLDGEGVAFERPYFYVVGSHGCSRNSDKFRLSSFLLARVRIDDDGRIVAPDGSIVEPRKSTKDHVETTYGLANALEIAPRVASYFAKDLDEKINGLNIEGIAVVNGRLFAGLRAPVLEREAFLVSVDAGKLFARGSHLSTSDVDVIGLRLGKDMGIRDLAPVGDGRLLVLAGPAQKQQDVPYGLFLVDPAHPEKPTFLATLKRVGSKKEPGKAEAVLVLRVDANTMNVLVLFDSLENGGPREYRIPLR
jgi:hypothetical protein